MEASASTVEGSELGSDGASFSTAFGRRPTMVQLVRRFVSDFHDHIVLHPGCCRRHPSPWASQLSMAAHELVENAVSHGGETWFSITIEPEPDDFYAVQMKTRNRAAAHQQQTVLRMVHELNAASDPFAFYLELMAETARQPAGSGLGLARVCVEAEMEVSCSIDGEQLEVLAQARIPHPRSGSGRDPSHADGLPGLQR